MTQIPAAAQNQHAIIVSHGQPSDPTPAEDDLARLARRVDAAMTGWSVHSATLAAPGILEDALSRSGAAPVIYPLFMTDGWFTKSALPSRVNNDNARILRPLGTDPLLVDLAFGWLRTTLVAKNWAVAETTLVIGSHGSGRSRQSARDTLAFAKTLNTRLPFCAIHVGFIEEAPFIKDVAANVADQAVFLPFFAARGEHVRDDIPEALDQAGFSGLCLDPIGTHPDIADLIGARLKQLCHAGINE